MMSIFKKINNYIHNPKIFQRVVLNHLGPFIKDDATFIKLKWKISDMQYPLNLENPKTFSEKLQWLKLHDRKPIYTTMVDKVEAKKYVANIIGEEYIIPTIAVWNSADEIDWDVLPNQFVMKCSHDSGGIIICKDKSKLDKKKAVVTMRKGLKRRYFWQNREWPYKNVTPRIIVEQYMEDKETKELRDYKFFCFEGGVKFCQVISERAKQMSIDFYDKNWNHQDFHEPYSYPFNKDGIEKPTTYETMWNIAALLSKNHSFLRVDLYESNKKVYFGELTFFPTSGMGGFDPVEWDYKFGEWIKLPKRS